MKFPFFKALLISGAMLAAWNCSDNAVPSLPNGIAIEETVKELNTGNETLYIADDNTVKNDKGEVVGSYDPTTGTVTDTSGNTVVENVSKDELDDTTISYPDPNAPVDGNTPDNGYGSGSGTNNGTVNGGSNTGSNSGSTGGSNTGSTGGNTSSGTTGGNTGSGTQQGGSTGGTTSQNCGSDKCFDKRSNQCVGHYSELIGPNGEKYAYKNDCSIECWWDGSNSGCANIFGSGSGNNQPASSSSQVKSSNSTAQSSNSQSTPELSGSCPNIVYANNDAARPGFATRYWDCAKPSCTWKGNAAQGTGASARSCALDGETRIYDTEATSALDGGSATTCKSQAAFTINGCDNMGFAFAAAPNNAACGRCYELTFTGEGKYETKKNHRLLKGKKLIIMASNIGYDVAGEQFDIMIPGGGVGEKNACGRIGFNQGTTVDYGGMLTDCENEVGYGGDDTEIYTKRKECLTRKCKATFSGDALRGCLFLSDFMEAAGNPLHTYREIECPQVLKDRY